MKAFTLLSNEFYQLYVYFLKIIGVLGLLIYAVLATIFIVGGMEPPYLYFLLLIFAIPFSLISITPFLPVSAKLFGKKISIEQEQICIYSHKNKLLKAYSFDSIIASPKTVIFHSFRGVLVEHSCVVLHTDPNLFANETDDNSEPPMFGELQRMDDTYVVHNPEVIALLKQIFQIKQD